MTKNSETFPAEIAEQGLKKDLEPLLDQLYEIKEKFASDPIKSATLELTLCQAINSLFYLYLQTTGVDARTHSINHELFRVDKYMNRLDSINDKVLRPKLNARAANAFVRNALFDAEDWKEDNVSDSK